MWKVGREKQKFEKGRKDVLKAEEVEGRRGKNKDEWKEGKAIEEEGLHGKSMGPLISIMGLNPCRIHVEHLSKPCRIHVESMSNPLQDTKPPKFHRILTPLCRNANLDLYNSNFCVPWCQISN